MNLSKDKRKSKWWFWTGFFGLWDFSGRFLMEQIPEEEPLDAVKGFQYSANAMRNSMAEAYRTAYKKED